MILLFRLEFPLALVKGQRIIILCDIQT
jgi:hypothetical protein